MWGLSSDLSIILVIVVIVLAVILSFITSGIPQLLAGASALTAIIYIAVHYIGKSFNKSTQDQEPATTEQLTSTNTNTTTEATQTNDVDLTEEPKQPTTLLSGIEKTEEQPEANEEQPLLYHNGTGDTEDNRPYYEHSFSAFSSEPTYTTCYPPTYVETNDCSLTEKLSFDEANTRMSALRQRDKKAIDGLISKNSNYFKKYFGRELDESEHKRWWGNDAI